MDELTCHHLHTSLEQLAQGAYFYLHALLAWPRFCPSV
jgi:hypothetical protein